MMEFTAYVSSERYCGKCALMLIREKDFTRKEYELHSFILSFNHEGIKEYHLQKLMYLNTRGWQEELHGYVRIEYLEAVALLQDAYRQNCKFGTKTAGNLASYQTFLEHDLANLDRECLQRKLSLHNLDPAGFTHVYLHALKSLDYALLYDLSGSKRKAVLGKREDFLASAGEDWSRYTFLKSKFVREEKKGREIFTQAYIVVCTPEEKVLKIDYQFVLYEGKYGLVLDDFQEIVRQDLTTEHPENPLNYHVFCSAYTIFGPAVIRNWLLSMPDVFLTGEFENGECYKLLKVDENPLQGFDVTAGIICEFILNEQELIIYAPLAVNLARMERVLANEIKKKVVFKHKYYLPIRELYKTVVFGHSLEGILHEKAQENVGPRHEMFSAFSCSKNKGYLVNLLRDEATDQVKLDYDTWYFIRERRDERTKQMISFIEYYVVGNWIRINVFGESIEEVQRRFGHEAEFILEKELKKYYEVFSIQLSAERKWQIYRILKDMGKEAPTLKEMGIVPSVKATALALGSVC